VGVRVESKVSSHEGEGLAGPDPSIWGLRYGIILDTLESSLCVFGHSGSCKQAESCPVKYSLFDFKENHRSVTQGLKEGR
jgi:hypothetical protein